MKFDFKKSKRIRSAAVIAWALCVFSGTTTAGSYQSSVRLPVIHSKDYLYKADLPVGRGVPPGAVIKNVSWNWNVTGWPRGMEVYLCQVPSTCVNISRQRQGSRSASMGDSQTGSFLMRLEWVRAGKLRLPDT
ncbi:flagellar protein FlhE [Pseudomonas alliivorans]|uniref:flagellar protein FlhE n=1 Tax=Pseudomonas alliivorans TaxID=2810613 RepID=UPI00209079BA|nr:flagellar protein FlhE [Pseudomonas alliivorans]MCO5364027.1 flagellar protein FlhE [Pseudomonas alliivorans]MEE4947492.1 flagellar protein FlhE [Pseudomonas alliivorans]MEE5101978.1 flagellar protein FlhE [Pseudomonas alliivorans]